jgi:hypothetical protein
MADGPGGREVGRISVRVLPDTSKFGVSLEKYLKRMEARLRLDIPVSLDQAGVAASEQELAILTKDRQVNIHTNVDKSQLDQLTTAVGKVTSGRGGGGLFSGLTSSLPSVIAAIGTLGPVLAGVVGGLIVAIPGILFAIAAPLAVIVAGFQGIKDAAAVAMPAFQALQAALSTTFMETLTPVFQTLATLLPVIAPAMQSLASALSGVFAIIVQELAKPENAAIIQDLFTGLAAVIGQLTPLIGPLVTLLLSMARDFIQAMIQNGPAFIAGMSFILGIFQRMSNDGTIQNAILLLMLFMTGALEMVGLVVAGLTWMGGVVTGAFMALAGWISSAIQNFAGFKAAVGQHINGAIAWIQGLPARVMSLDWQGMLFNAGKFLIGGLIDGIMAMLGPVGTAIGAIAGLIKSHFPGSPVKTGPLTAWNNGGAGKRLGSMLASGLTASTSDVRSAARGLAGGVALNDPALAFGGAGAGGAGVVQNFHGNIYPNDMASFQRDMAQRRRAAAYSTTRRAQ